MEIGPLAQLMTILTRVLILFRQFFFLLFFEGIQREVDEIKAELKNAADSDYKKLNRQVNNSEKSIVEIEE